MLTRVAGGLALVTALSGCLGGGGGGAAAIAAGTLPVTGTGTILGVTLPSTVTTSTNNITGLPQIQTDPTSVSVNDRTPQGGIGFTASADADPNPAQFQAGGTSVAALISGNANAALAGGTTVNGFTDAKGAVFFENGNFGDPQAESNDGAVSTVSVYNLFQNNQPTGQIVLSDVTTVRYRGRTNRTGEAFYGVGYIGNATATMPTGQTITYTGFWENGQAVYNNGNGANQFYLRVNDTVSLSADLTANTITGSANASMDRDINLGANTITLTTDVERLVLNGTVTGNTFAGTALLVDSGGNTVGTQTGEMVGGFFGANATEIAAAIQNSGTMTLEGANATYVLQGVIGGTSR